MKAKEHSILEIKGMLIKVGRDKVHQNEFEVETPGYQLLLQRGEDRLRVINGVDGYGNNCRAEFENEDVVIYS